MKIISQALDGIQLILPSIYKDNRGSFVEKLNANIINDFDIKQINQSISHKNVFRGFHFQSNLDVLVLVSTFLLSFSLSADPLL